jgi:hypothetical protein
MSDAESSSSGTVSLLGTSQKSPDDTVFNFQISTPDKPFTFFNSVMVNNHIGSYTIQQLIDMETEAFDRFYSVFISSRQHNYGTVDGKGSERGVLFTSYAMADLIMNDILTQRKLKELEARIH